MKVIVKPHEIKIKLENDYNSGEYNVQECNFEFSDEYTGLSKVVIFSNSNVTKEIQIYNDKCIVPAEVLQNEGVVGIGVYGYEVSEDELTLRYSPKPQCFPVEKGSYAEGTQPTPPTPSVVEQLQQQITNNANNISSLQDLTASQGEQIETNTNDISAIKSEQTTQNNNIQANTEEIESINGIIPTLAKKTEIPTKVSQLENDSNYVTETEMSNAIDEEKIERENADIELQSQIDAITVSPDVVDVVGTYQELLDYDTSKLTDDDIIKVLVDSTHNDALSYYRWQITGGIGSWHYIGSEGPFYTKSETDSLLNEKQDEITNDNKLDSDLVSDDGQTNKFVTIQEKNIWNNKQDALTFDNTPTKNSNNPVKSGGIYDFVNTKLEDYVLETDFEESQSLQDEEIARNKMIYNAMPKVSGEGTDLTLDNTAECPVYDIELSPSELEQATTSGKNLFDKNTATTIGYLEETGNIHTSGAGADWRISDYINIQPNTTYTTSGMNTAGNSPSRCYYDENKNFISGIKHNNTNPFINTSPSNAYFMRESISNTDLDTTQVELGDTATSYEPFTYGSSPNPEFPQQIHTVSGENTITISNSDNTQSQTYPLSLSNLEYCKIGDYEDEFYKATESDTGLTAGKWYLKKNIGKVVLDGSESWVKAYSGIFNHMCLYSTPVIRDIVKASTNILYSDYFTYSSSYNEYVGEKISLRSNGSIGIILSDEKCPSYTVAEVKAWVSEHNTIVYYILATPTYTLLSDTLQTQLDNIQKAITYQDQTNVSQTNNDLPFVIKLSAIRDLSGIFELIQG